MQYENEDVYKADGTFDVEKARQACHELMEYRKHPICPRPRGEEFWAIVTEYATYHDGIGLRLTHPDVQF